MEGSTFVNENGHNEMPCPVGLSLVEEKVGSLLVIIFFIFYSSLAWGNNLHLLPLAPYFRVLHLF